MSFMLVIKTKVSNRLNYSFTFSQLRLYYAKSIFFNYKSLKENLVRGLVNFESVGRSVGAQVVDGQLVDGRWIYYKTQGN